MKTEVNSREFERVVKLSRYNHNVYTNGEIHIRETCDDDNWYGYDLVDKNDKFIRYLGGIVGDSIFDAPCVIELDDSIW